MGPLEKINAEVAARIEADIRAFHDGEKSVESPIERIFITAFHAVMVIGHNNFTKWLLLKNADDLPVKDPKVIYLTTQARILQYRVDFLFQVFNGKDYDRLVVECDGHDFHERTKEQAAKDKSRDRELSLAGCTVFRFTGSELYRDPMSCAYQVERGAFDRHYSRMVE